MAFAYIVRCNFTEPAKEQAWNAWYSGPKIAQMLQKPLFRTCQRFKRTAGIGRNYLALWTLPLAGRVQDRAIHHRLGVLRMGAVYHRLEP